MAKLPTHPFKPNLPSDPGDSVNTSELDDLHTRALAHLEGVNSTALREDINLVSVELSQLPPADAAHRLALARTTDSELREYAKHASAPVAWCICDLRYLAASEERYVFEMLTGHDPAGVVGPFVANMSISDVGGEAAIQCLCDSGDEAKLDSVGSMLFRLLRNGLLYGQPLNARLAFTSAMSPAHGKRIIVSLFQHIALELRVSSSSPIPSHFSGWLALDGVYLRPLLQSAAVVTSLMRDSANVDVFMLGMLADCENGSLLGPAAVRRTHLLSEQLFKDRFSSVLDRKDDTSITERYFRDYEFDPLVRALELVGIDAFAFRQIFLDLASDGYWRLVAPSAQETERHRAVMLVAVGALVAHHRGDNDLKAVVQECASLLHTQRQSGRHATPIEVARRVALVGLKLPDL